MLLNWLVSADNRIVFIRILVTTVLFGTSSIIYLLNDQVKIVLYFIIVILLVYLSSLLSLIVNSYSDKYRKKINIFSIVLDVFISTLVITVTGGVTSPFIFLYALILIHANILFNNRIVSYVLSVVLGLLFLTIIVTKPRIFDSDNSYDLSFQATFDIDQTSLVYTYFNLAGFLLISMLSGLLSERTRLARQELGESKKSLNILKNLNDNILRSLDSGVITLDQDGKIISANNKSMEILGINKNPSILNKYLGEFITGIELDDLISKRREQILYTNPEGFQLYLGFSSSILKDENNEKLGYVLIFQDLTEIKDLEEKLRAAEKLAILGQLASGLTHEIRNPLSAISGAIEILSTEVNPTSSNERLLSVANQEIERMKLLVDDFSIMNHPIPKIDSEVNINDILSDIIETFTRTIKRSNIEVKSELNDVLYVVADSFRLKQVFWNLLTNSMQSMTNEGMINVKAYKDDHNAIVKLTDDGCGISQKNLSRIFEPFFTTKKSGTGLGLAIVQKIIENYNGKIDVISTENVGSTFIISFPLAK